MKAVVKMLVFGVVLTGVISTAGADTITIQGSDEVIDSFLLGDGGTPIDGNYGGPTRITVDINGIGDSSYTRNGVFRWDLGNVPWAGRDVGKVEILLYVSSYDTTSRNYDLRQITGGNWVETEVTAKVRKDGIDWANQSPYPWGDIGTTTYGAFAVTNAGSWTTVSSDDNPNLLTLVRGMIDGTESNYGFSVQAPTEVEASFRSTDYTTDPSTQPKMVITYVVPPQGTTIIIQ